MSRTDTRGILATCGNCGFTCANEGEDFYSRGHERICKSGYCAGCTDPINHPHAFDCEG